MQKVEKVNSPLIAESVSLENEQPPNNNINNLNDPSVSFPISYQFLLSQNDKDAQVYLEKYLSTLEPNSLIPGTQVSVKSGSQYLHRLLGSGAISKFRSSILHLFQSKDARETKEEEDDDDDHLRDSDLHFGSLKSSAFIPMGRTTELQVPAPQQEPSDSEPSSAQRERTAMASSTGNLNISSSNLNIPSSNLNTSSSNLNISSSNLSTSSSNLTSGPNLSNPSPNLSTSNTGLLNIPTIPLQTQPATTMTPSRSQDRTSLASSTGNLANPSSLNLTVPHTGESPKLNRPIVGSGGITPTEDDHLFEFEDELRPNSFREKKTVSFGDHLREPEVAFGDAKPSPTLTPTLDTPQPPSVERAFTKSPTADPSLSKSWSNIEKFEKLLPDVSTTEEKKTLPSDYNMLHVIPPSAYFKRAERSIGITSATAPKRDTLDWFKITIGPETLASKKYGIIISPSIFELCVNSGGYCDFLLLNEISDQLNDMTTNVPALKKLSFVHAPVKKGQSLKSLQEVCSFKKAFEWDEKRYFTYCQYLIETLNGLDWQTQKIVHCIEAELQALQYVNDTTSIKLIEKLFISLLGDNRKVAREAASRNLNSIYDGHIFQNEEALAPVIRSVGNDFVVEIDVSEWPETSREDIEQLYLIISNNGAEKAISVYKPDCSRLDRPLRISLDPFTSPGFYDWAWAVLDTNTGYFKLSVDDFELTRGRVVVQPEMRERVFHQIVIKRGQDHYFGAVDPNFQVDSFLGAALVLRELKKFGITDVCILGALSDPSGDGFTSTDKAMPSAALGGKEGFQQLVSTAEELEINLIVDSLFRVCKKGFNRKYRNLFCQTLAENGSVPVPLPATDGRDYIWRDSLQLNYRKMEVWDLLIHETLELAQQGAGGIRIHDAHLWPAIFQPNLDELLKVDTDKEFFYSTQEIIEGAVVNPQINPKTGFWSTSASATYANPLFVKLVQEIWKKHPDFIFLANVSWGREGSAISSGLVPYSESLAQAVRSVYNVRLASDPGNLPGRTSVQSLYHFYQYQRPNYPQNSFLLFPSSSFSCPSPVHLFGAGAWTEIDLLYFLPEGPSTSCLELVPTMLRDRISEKSKEVQGHYEHRAQLRRNFPVLRNGGFIPLFTFWGGGWHDKVFAFARLTQEEPLNLVVIAINFNDAESIVYIDTSPLKEFIDENHQNDFFRVTDLINQSTSPQFFSREEFLNEKIFLVLKPNESICQGVWVHNQSSSSERMLFENSINRLHNHLKYSTDPAYNAVYELILEKVSGSDVDAVKDLFQSLSEKFEFSQFKFSLPQLLQQTFYWICSKDESQKLKILATLTQIATESSSKQPKAVFVAKEILKENILGPIVFITPEIGRFSTVGGVGVMVNEFTQTLAALGMDVHVVSPYYNYNRKGETDYLKKEGFKYLHNIATTVGHQYIEMGVWSGIEHGVKLHFLHNYKYFVSPYSGGSAQTQTETLSLFAKGSLECLCQLRILPSLILSNDWFAGLVPAYAKRSNFFGSTFGGATTLHLIHNLEIGYEGKVYSHENLGYITQLPNDIILDWEGVLNPSYCALRTCDQWCTVSNSYKDDLLRGSSLAGLLRSFRAPFAHSNGVRLQDRLDIMAKVAPSHEVAKAMLQKKYFGKSDPSIPVFSFVGRIVVQKGVHLILNAMDELNHYFQGRIQFIIGGMANKSDPYAGQCAWKMEALRKSCPQQFWADPTQFFTDGPLLNLGSDFGLMPSLFEPSGVVQQEYFAGSTPVIAFLTGGLKDTVSEFIPPEGTGNGFTFMAHEHRDYVDAIKRSVAVFNNKEQYQLLRKNARESVLDVDDVAAQWISEFTRLRKRFWAPESKINELIKTNAPPQLTPETKPDKKDDQKKEK